ncbi:MAG: hypothetical protein HS116_19875 [Planctomycetes bacterium]|nr:hypothetical protein [Planctomycetota bacterium]
MIAKPLFRAVLLSASLAAFALHGGEAAPAVVSHVKVVSDKVEDVSSFEAWKQAVIKDGMTDEQKALAVWEAVVKFRHHDSSPREYLGLSDSSTVDAIKLFNVYGYCSGAAAQPAFLQLARQAGFEARGMSIHKWGVPEVRYGDAWHMFDPGMICYFRKPDGTIASTEEIVAAVKEWHAANPGYMGDDAKIKAFQKDGGHKRGPALIANCPTYDERGSFPLNYFGWFSAMIIYDGSNKTPFLYEEAASQGYRVNIQLRKGERITRRWSNTGLHVSADTGGKVECLAGQVGKGPLYYTPKFGDLGNGRVGNGLLEYAPPLSDAATIEAFVSARNLAVNPGAGTLQAADAAQPAEFVVRMPCSYVYLNGTLEFEAAAGAGGAVSVFLSDDHGRAWKELAKAEAAGAQKIDLTPHVLRRYDYRLKFVLTGAGTSVSALKLTHAVQHSQRALPALGQGENKLAFSAGPAEGTITLEGAGLKFKDKQVTYEALGAVLEGIDPATFEKWGTWSAKGSTGSITFPVETPGDLARLRFGCNYRAGSDSEGWDLQVSFDDGKSFKTVGRAAGPTRQSAKWVAFEEIPPGTRKALVRYSAQARGSCVIFRYRIDADYREPHGGFAPVRVTYRWEEKGQAKEDARVLDTPQAAYAISCAEKPMLKEIVLERAD